MLHVDIYLYIHCMVYIIIYISNISHSYVSLQYMCCSHRCACFTFSHCFQTCSLIQNWMSRPTSCCASYHASWFSTKIIPSQYISYSSALYNLTSVKRYINKKICVHIHIHLHGKKKYFAILCFTTHWVAVWLCSAALIIFCAQNAQHFHVFIHESYPVTKLKHTPPCWCLIPSSSSHKDLKHKDHPTGNILYIHTHILYNNLLNIGHLKNIFMIRVYHWVPSKWDTHQARS